MHHFHGLGTHVAPDVMAFSQRRTRFMTEIVAVWEPGSKTESAVHRQWASDLSTVLAPLALPGGYSNFLAPGAHERIGSAYGSNASRLLELKRKLDPGNAFPRRHRCRSKSPTIGIAQAESPVRVDDGWRVGLSVSSNAGAGKPDNP
jgi:hypothetical protein